jgi:DNA-binding NtrC family response regulator
MQVLVIDEPNGPASVLINTISLLLDREISVTAIEDHAEALRALDDYAFDLVMVGLHEQRAAQLTILPRLQHDCPDLPVLAVGQDLPLPYQQYARNYGAREVLDLPRRAADLKQLVAHVAERYLAIAA